MLIPNHPDDERLSALASRDDDATTDTALTSHVSSCARCKELVNEIRVLRASLSELPDLKPTRPLRLLPPAAEPEAAGGPVAWVRRLFAPVLTAGATLALVGVVGTAAPALSGGAQGAAGTAEQEGDMALEAAASQGAGAGAAAAEESAAAEGATVNDGTGRVSSAAPAAAASADEGVRTFSGEPALPAERSPWPMVLFTGVAIMIGAALLRWIVVPRAG